MTLSILVQCERIFNNEFWYFYVCTVCREVFSSFRKQILWISSDVLTAYASCAADVFNALQEFCGNPDHRTISQLPRDYREGDVGLLRRHLALTPGARSHMSIGVGLRVDGLCPNAYKHWQVKYS